MRRFTLFAALAALVGCTPPAEGDSAEGDTADTTEGLAEPSFLTVFLDGPVAEGSDFWSVPESQPAVRYVVPEADGTVTHFFLDVGCKSEPFEHNLDVDTSVQGLPVEEAGVDFVLISHLHSLLTIGGGGDAGGIRRLLEDNPELGIYMPDTTGLTYDLLDPLWEEQGLLERAVVLPEGYSQLTPRVGVFGSRFQEEAREVVEALGQADLQENLLLVDTGEGYHVHSVCGHLPVETLDGRAVHPVELVQDELGEAIPAGEIVSVLTGGCDAQRIGEAAGYAPEEAWSYTLASLREHLPGLLRLGLAHCGLPLEPICREVFGDACVLGTAGATLHLAP